MFSYRSSRTSLYTVNCEFTLKFEIKSDLKFTFTVCFCQKESAMSYQSLAMQGYSAAYLRFWYHVLTCVSVRPRHSATSALSATLRYFWQPNLRSRYCSWACVKAVLRRRSFLGADLPPPLPPSSAVSEQPSWSAKDCHMDDSRCPWSVSNPITVLIYFYSVQ